MKRLLPIATLLLFLFITQQINAQDTIRLSQPTFVGVKDTIRINDSVRIQYYAVNESSTSYTRRIYTHLRTNLSAAIVSDSQQVFIIPGDSQLVQARFLARAPQFQENQKSIVVVWPTGTGTKFYFDTITIALNVEETVSIKEINNSFKQVRFYPNPAAENVKFEIIQPGIRINTIRIYDLSGKQVRIGYNDFFNNSLEIKYLNKGIYLLDINLSDGTLARYKLIKQ